MSTKGSFSRLHRSRPKDTGTTFPSQKIRESSEVKNVSKQKPAAAASVFQVKPTESRDNAEKGRVQGRPGESSRHLEQRSPRSAKTRETLQVNGYKQETQVTTIKPERSKFSFATTHFPEREIVVYTIVSLPPTASEIRRNLQTGREVDGGHQNVTQAQQVAISRNQTNVQAQVEENLRQQKVIDRQKKEISKHVDVIESQADEILRLKNIIEAQKQEISKQAGIIRNQREEISKHAKVANEQNEKISSQNKCIRDQEDEITKHLKVIQDQKRTNTELSQQIQDLQPQLQKSKAQILNFKTVLQALEDHITNVEATNMKLTRNNEFLTSCIAETKVAPTPIHNESHYIDQIESLKHLVSSRVAELCKSEECKTFRVSEQVIGEVLRRLQECGLFGRRTGTFLSKGMIWDLHLDSRRRIAVLRHIIALFLHTYIFDTFAFGLDATSSKLLRDIENTTLLIGRPTFSLELMDRTGLL
jgi:DNA repair exonuclease SbcCD ATPase subunit